MVLMPTKPTRQNVVKRLQAAVAESGESLYAVAKGSGIDYSVLTRFMNNERGMNLTTAARLMDYLGLELRPVKGRGK